jgi:hypothetical protein
MENALNIIVDTVVKLIARFEEAEHSSRKKIMVSSTGPLKEASASLMNVATQLMEELSSELKQEMLPLISSISEASTTIMNFANFSISSEDGREVLEAVKSILLVGTKMLQIHDLQSVRNLAHVGKRSLDSLKRIDSVSTPSQLTEIYRETNDILSNFADLVNYR